MRTPLDADSGLRVALAGVDHVVVAGLRGVEVVDDVARVDVAVGVDEADVAAVGQWRTRGAAPRPCRGSSGCTTTRTLGASPSMVASEPSVDPSETAMHLVVQARLLSDVHQALHGRAQRVTGVVEGDDDAEVEGALVGEQRVVGAPHRRRVHLAALVADGRDHQRRHQDQVAKRPGEGVGDGQDRGQREGCRGRDGGGRGGAGGGG